jgi:hypothetical protein
MPIAIQAVISMSANFFIYVEAFSSLFKVTKLRKTIHSEAFSPEKVPLKPKKLAFLGGKREIICNFARKTE